MNATRWGAAVVAGLLLVSACSSSDAPDSSDGAAEPATTVEPEPGAGSDTPSPADGGEPTPTAPVVAAVELEPPAQVVTFGNVDFHIASAEISNEDPASRSAGLGVLSPSTWLYLDIGVENPSTDAMLTINDRTFAGLRVGDTVLSAQLFSEDISPRSVIRPGTEGTYQVFYEVGDDFEFTDAGLVLGAPEFEPVELPFGDTSSAPPSFPRSPAVVLAGEVTGREVCGATRLAAEMLEVAAALDLPADLRATGGLPQRALLGQVFVELTVAFTVVVAPERGGVGGGGGCVGTIVSDELLSLSADGAPAEARYIEGGSGFEAQVGDTRSLTVGFMVPREAALTATLGNPVGETISGPIPID